MIKIFKKVIRVISKGIAIVIAVSLVINIISNFLSADEIAREHQRVIADFKTIQHPENSKEISHTEEEIRRPIYSVEYQYTLDHIALEQYYDKELEKRGWKKENRIEFNPPTSFSYAKGKSEISFSKIGTDVWRINLRYRKNKEPV